MAFKSGFISIIGRPNVGKSTLLNALLGEKLTIITPKVQTTRNRIRGILNTPEHQLVFSDTPGIIPSPQYKLHSKMMHQVNESLTDADVILYLTDMDVHEDDTYILDRLSNLKTPIIGLVNKMDLGDQESVAARMEALRARVPFRYLLPISALNKFNLQSVLTAILEFIPEGPAFFDQDQLTDKSERFVAAEIIREKIFMRYKEEIPYSVQVEIETFREEPAIIHIGALIYTMRESQKQILIGKGGIALKNTGIAARRDLELFFKKQVHLTTFVKVKKDWRDNDQLLRQFGYESTEE